MLDELYDIASSMKPSASSSDVLLPRLLNDVFPSAGPHVLEINNQILPTLARPGTHQGRAGPQLGPQHQTTRATNAPVGRDVSHRQGTTEVKGPSVGPEIRQGRGEPRT